MGLSIGGQIAGAHIVDRANIQRVHVERFGNGIHLLLVGIASLGAAKTAKGAGKGLVCGNGKSIDIHVINPIRAGCHAGGIEQDVRAQVGIGTGIGDQFDFGRCYATIVLDAGPVGHDKGMAFRLGSKGFFTGENQLNRFTGRSRQQR